MWITKMTAQITDKIRYKRRIYNLFSEPLEAYFNEQHPKPEVYRHNLCSACWRGYLAKWSVKRSKLYLDYILRNDYISPIDETLEDTYRRNLSEIFQDKTAPIFAEWYSGDIRLVSGEMLQYVHLPYASIFETEIVLHILEGKVLDN
jgi:hypothetical protein